VFGTGLLGYNVGGGAIADTVTVNARDGQVAVLPAWKKTRCYGFLRKMKNVKDCATVFVGPQTLTPQGSGNQFGSTVCNAPCKKTKIRSGFKTKDCGRYLITATILAQLTGFAVFNTATTAPVPVNAINTNHDISNYPVLELVNQDGLVIDSTPLTPAMPLGRYGPQDVTQGTPLQQLGYFNLNTVLRLPKCTSLYLRLNNPVPTQDILNVSVTPSISVVEDLCSRFNTWTMQWLSE